MGTKNSSIPKLEDVLKLLYWVGNENGAVQKLMDFIKQVEALEDKKNNHRAGNLFNR